MIKLSISLDRFSGRPDAVLEKIRLRTAFDVDGMT